MCLATKTLLIHVFYVLKNKIGQFMSTPKTDGDFIFLFSRKIQKYIIYNQKIIAIFNNPPPPS